MVGAVDSTGADGSVVSISGGAVVSGGMEGSGSLKVGSVTDVVLSSGRIVVVRGGVVSDGVVLWQPVSVNTKNKAKNKQRCLNPSVCTHNAIISRV